MHIFILYISRRR